MVQHDETQPAGGQQYEQSTGSHSRTVQLISGDYLLTINPVDGSEIESCPPGRRPSRPRKFSTDERPGPRHPEHSLTGVPVPPVPAAAVLLEREEEREALTRLLTHGRSVRLVGEPGTGRSALLDAVAEDVETLAPDGVVRLSGYRRTLDELLRALFTATHDSPYVRPVPARLLEALATVGAVVLVDDVELASAELDQLLESAPECAFLVTAPAGVAALDATSRFTETQLPGLSRTCCAELLEHAVQRPLTEEETDWVGDLWFESEGRPLRFVQAGALLRQRDVRRTEPSSGTSPETLPPAAPQGNAPGLVARLAGGLPGPAQEALCLAVALDGELPHPTTRLSALAEDDSLAEEFVELAASGLVSTVGGRMTLAVGVLDDLTAAGYGVGSTLRVTSAAQHYAWWVGHASVSGPRASAEAEAVLAALRGARRGEQPSTAVLLARAAAPVFAGALRWGAWERVVRAGQEAARLTGQAGEEAYFRHELGVHALCTGDLARARVELEASIALRGAFTDRSGTVAGRRALALVSDRAAAAEAGAGGTSPGTRGAATAPEIPPNSPTSRVSPVAPSPAPDPPDKADQPWASEETPGPGSPVLGLAASHQSSSEQHRSEVGGSYTGAEAVNGPASETDPYGPAPVLPLGAGLGAGAGAGEQFVDEEPETLVSRSAAAGQGGTKPPRRLAALGTSRNMVAAGAGALLAVVLGTVVTIGSTSNTSDDRSPADTVQPDESNPQGVDSTTPSEEVSEQPDSPRSSSKPASEPPEPAPDTSRRTSPPESSHSPSTSPPEDPTTTPEDPTTSPEDPTTSPEDPTTSPEDPTTSPEDPTNSPEDPEPSSSPEESSSQDTSTPQPGTESPAATPSAE